MGTSGDPFRMSGLYSDCAHIYLGNCRRMRTYPPEKR